MKIRNSMLLLGVFLVLKASSAQQDQTTPTIPTTQANATHLLAVPNDERAGVTVLMEELTWPELKSKVAQGFLTVLLPCGGTEQGGPHLALGKHNFIIQSASQRIATQLGNTLVAPVIPYVPEGDFEKPSGNMLFPGTIGLSEETFARTLIEASTSLMRAGFKVIVLIADHGQSLPIQDLVAENLTKQWQTEGVRVISLRAYYSPEIEAKVLTDAGIAQNDWGDHAGVADTAELWSVRPSAVRVGALQDASPNVARNNGASGRPQLATPTLGKEMMELRIQSAVKQIKELLRQ